jgi:DNA-binding NarL/FixJ family response regulator
MGKRIQIVLVAKAYLVVSGLENLFAEFPGIVLLESFEGDENNLSRKILHRKPDMVIIDPSCIKQNLVGLINELLRQNNLIIVGLNNAHTADNIKSHFSGCLDVGEGKHELINSFRSILGRNYSDDQESNTASTLSERERTIVRQVVSGFTNQEIADKLFLSIHTVNTHRKNISNKLGIKTVSGLTVYALMNKIVDIHEIEHK